MNKVNFERKYNKNKRNMCFTPTFGNKLKRQSNYDGKYF